MKGGRATVVLSSRGGPPVPAHQVTTRNLGAAYPLMAEAGLGHRGVVIGRDLLGGSFVYDPFDLYAAGVVSNPNMIVFGQIGRGKSALVKTYLWRQSVFGRRAWVVDPKGEYTELARQWGTEPVSLRPGGTVRLNPLDPSPGRGAVAEDGHRTVGGAATRAATADEVDRRHSELLASLASACLRRDLVPRERVAIDLALATATADRAVPTVPAVVDALLEPTASAARRIRTDAATLLEDGRDVALELRRLVHGDLRGMFDGPTTRGLDLSAPLVVLDLSALYSSPALGVLMACATAWLQAALARGVGRPRDGGGQVLVVVDEAWAILANLGMQLPQCMPKGCGQRAAVPTVHPPHHPPAYPPRVPSITFTTDSLDYFLDVLHALCRDGVAVTIVPRHGEAFEAVLMGLGDSTVTYEGWNGVEPNGELGSVDVEEIEAVTVW